MSIKLAMDVKKLQAQVAALESQLGDTVKLVADCLEKISGLRIEITALGTPAEPAPTNPRKAKA